MEGLKLFARTSDRKTWNVASYHSPHSMTWRWILSFAFFRSDERKAWPIFGSWKTHGGKQWLVRVPYVGILQFHQQQPMWFRDLYRSARDREDELKSYIERNPPPSSRSPFLPTVIDGGQSLH